MSGFAKNNPLAESLTSDSEDDDRIGAGEVVRVEIDDDTMAELKNLAEDRAQSYQDGAASQFNTNYAGGDGVETHLKGLKGEYALSVAFDSAELDREVHELGDDGADSALEIGGETLEADVKAFEFHSPDLLVKQDIVPESNHEHADVYVLARLDGNVVDLLGFARNEEIIVEENLEESPAEYLDHMNYTMDQSELKPMPETDTDGVEIVLA